MTDEQTDRQIELRWLRCAEAVSAFTCKNLFMSGFPAYLFNVLRELACSGLVHNVHILKLYCLKLVRLALIIIGQY